MSLTPDEFAVAARDFASISHSLDDGWQLYDGHEIGTGNPANVYLVKKVIKEKSTSVRTRHREADEITDPQEAPLQANGDLLCWEYNVAYSLSFEAPALYFDICYSNGETLSLEDVWSACCSEGKVLDLELKDMWGTVTRQEHPITRRPYFVLHPCNTHEIMGPLLKAQGERRINYLITWLSSVGPAVGLRLSIGYNKGTKKSSTTVSSLKHYK
ncbi:ubiquitin-like-conjugating enzyme ATG10 [Varroa jacobsoni]|uniref:ubiquitin-like-conjugating enzyme ATG10 n=1 Tax=Varroa jacobsoni TaxID=62625 RepID=UPI000BF4367C|nr:ubiquitin-like-conjugating enzyme ATG10 [Varroa jacobsoni]XP_022707239.1 ubiquitin-like-conjugating enzyme ATG10 [Varroa jacobsoni]XP_022707240.1 ubiquitin-like-conjugating enzyme ATG10 [Varroa jacobsoni]